MYYLLLTHHDEARWRVLPSEERDAVAARLREDEEFRAAGQVLATGVIDPATGAIALRRRDGDFVPVDDDPREGFSIRDLAVIEARDLNDAIRVASRHPAASLDERLGWAIEIRRFDRFEPEPRKA